MHPHSIITDPGAEAVLEAHSLRVSGAQDDYVVRATTLDALSVGYKQDLTPELQVYATGIVRMLRRVLEDTVCPDATFCLGNIGEGHARSLPRAEPTWQSRTS